LPIESAQSKNPFRRLMIAQDTGSAIIGPARADLYFGAGLDAGKVAGRLRHNARFVMLVPKSLDPEARGRKMPVPDDRPSAKIAKLFPQIAPSKDPSREQKEAANPPELTSATKAGATAVVAPPSPAAMPSQPPAIQAAVARPVPLPEPRPKVEAIPARPHPPRRYRHHR
jgi:membrane-bound lytic murein transglycosylase A